MLRFLEKQLKKPRKSSRKPVPLENPTQQIIDSGAKCGVDLDDIDHGRGSRIATRSGRVEDQQLTASKASTPVGPIPGHEAPPTHTHGGSAGAQSKKLDRGTPDLHRDESDSDIRNWREHEDQEPGVLRPQESASERTSGSDQDGGDAQNVVQSGKPRVKERGWVDQTLGRVVFAVDIAKGPAETFGPLKAVLESVSVLYTQYQNTVDVKDRIGALCTRIATLEKLFEKPAGDEKETERREELSFKLKDIEEQLQPLREKSAFLRFIDNAQDSKGVSGLLEDLQEVVGDYMMAQQMATYDQGCKLMDAAEKLALNNFRCANGAEFRHGGRKGCLKGTRGVVLNAIELWARDPSKSCVYWLNGLAGTGKSTIAKTIAERLFADGKLGGSFFCSRDFEDRRNIQLIFPTLATQLARRYTEFRSILVPLIQSDPGVAYESLYDQMDKLIVQPLSQSCISTVIIIDALDECEDEEPASAILSVLGRFTSEIPNVKFFLTGRPEPRISEGFRLSLSAKMTDVFVLHNVERDQVDSDIRLFFRTSFSELAGRSSRLDNWPAEEQLDHLCKRAAGLFVYAAATVKFVGNNKRGPRKQLDLLLESQKIGVREGKALDALYTSILQGAFGDGDPEDDARARSVLSAVVLAMNPLSPSTIATLLVFDTEDVLLLLSSVNSLLFLHEDPNHPVRPFHKSFPDFVTDSKRCTNEKFYISPPDHHLQLLLGCLDIMNRTLAKNMCKLPDTVANLDVSDLKERTDKYIDPALRYACLSWHAHLVDADMTPVHTPTITLALHQLLEEKFLFWLEVLSVLGAVKNAVEALQIAADWLEESSTLDLANECLLFVNGNFEVISASARHIYHSALVFAPQQSIVRKLYESHAHPFTRVVHGLPTSWGAYTVATMRPSEIKSAAWSPCDRFIAIALPHARTIEVLDSVTLQRLQTLTFPQEISTDPRSLIFSPDSRVLTSFGGHEGLFAVTWDLQTGGVASVIRWREKGKSILNSSIAYSANGKAVGIRCRYYHHDDVIHIFEVSSGVRTHSHSVSSTYRISCTSDFWTHGESLRFVTYDKTATTIWEVGFTSDVTPTVVKTLPPVVDNFEKVSPGCLTDNGQEGVHFHPAPYRFAVVFHGRNDVGVWDFRTSKLLLHCADTRFHRGSMSFSSDGRFFACRASGSEVHLWRESPTGYTLHNILACITEYPHPLLSPNGESIVAFGGPAIRSWSTKGSTTPSFSVSAGTPPRTEDFVLEFSPDGMLAVFAMLRDGTVTVLDLKSGVLQLTIDASMEVHGLGAIGNAITVIGFEKAVTWNLPTGDCVTDAKMTLEDSAWAINLGVPPSKSKIGASISPNSCHIAILGSRYYIDRAHLYIHDRSVVVPVLWISGKAWKPWFALSGCNLWLVDNDGEGKMVEIGCKRQVEPNCGADIEYPPEGYPWASSHGYQVTNDWWILGPDGKRVLMLPPPWQSPKAILRVWKGKFLALLHCGLSEPVILELEP